MQNSNKSAVPLLECVMLNSLSCSFTSIFKNQGHIALFNRATMIDECMYCFQFTNMFSQSTFLFTFVKLTYAKTHEL
jgi:hypothetical protein